MDVLLSWNSHHLGLRDWLRHLGLVLLLCLGALFNRLLVRKNLELLLNGSQQSEGGVNLKGEEVSDCLALLTFLLYLGVVAVSLLDEFILFHCLNHLISGRSVGMILFLLLPNSQKTLGKH